MNFILRRWPTSERNERIFDALSSVIMELSVMSLSTLQNEKAAIAPSTSNSSFATFNKSIHSDSEGSRGNGTGNGTNSKS